MPFYEYIHEGDGGCPTCRERFTRLQKLSEDALTECPVCGSAVRRLISPPHVVGGTAHRLKPDNIEKAGFTQYRKLGKGVYEKTAGKGPRIIKDD
ncbi:MAG: FmdB family zinc ribbon protein [Wenzhouxiangellaceae bacterium]|nr:FmdB family zinc ribbon protein [Wenzhouxiangellaceae bacterium]